jgi:IPT/TIG domain
MKHVNALHRLGKRIGANGPGITLTVIAIMIAVTGAAFAAGGALTTAQVKQVKSIIKKEATKLRGPQGLPGTPGQTGLPGARGETGAPGAPGSGGASVKVTSVLEGEEDCAELGGALVEKEGAGSPVEVCNGEKGGQGSKGEPWTPNNTLPAGATETGVWSFSASGEKVFVPVSFPIRLAGALPASSVHYQTDSDFASFCDGSPALPKARPGNLCVHEGNPGEPILSATFKSINKVGGNGSAGGAGTNVSGALVTFELTAANATGNGTFAVTAPNPIVSAVSPNQGPAAGGTSVTVTGENLRNGTVKFDETAAACTVNAAGTEAACTSPAHASGTVDVKITVGGYVSAITAADKFTYE